MEPIRVRRFALEIRRKSSERLRAFGQRGADLREVNIRVDWNGAAPRRALRAGDPALNPKAEHAGTRQEVGT